MQTADGSPISSARSCPSLRNAGPPDVRAARRTGPVRREMAGNAIRGHWITSRSLVNGSRYAMPLTLTRVAEGRWRGVVAPRDDEFTLSPAISTTMSAFLRNPDRSTTSSAWFEREAGSHSSAVGTAEEKRGARIGNVQRRGWRDQLVDSGRDYDFTRAAPPQPLPRYSYKRPLQRSDGWPTSTLAGAVTS